MESIQPRLPQAYHERLAHLEAWLTRLARTVRDDAPKRDESAALEEHFRGLWEVTGMDATIGLSRSTPDHRLFRAAVGRHLWESTLVRRCYEKPRGYAGDYLMMDAACNTPPAATSPIGRWMNRWFYDSFPPSLAARNRRDLAARILLAEHPRGARRVLNVACGGVPELVQVCGTSVFDELVLLDQDTEGTELRNSIAAGELP